MNAYYLIDNEGQYLAGQMNVTTGRYRVWTQTELCGWTFTFTDERKAVEFRNYVLYEFGTVLRVVRG